MAGYTRNDTGNNIADGNVINAADLDGEFDSIQTAFNETSGHTHDGTVGEGAPISVVGPAQDINVTITEVAPKTTNTMSLGTAALQFKDLYIDGTANIDSLVADTADINGGTIDGTTIGASTPAAITGTSITATGNITVAGTVDGRDVAADGTKLDTIETNADVTDTANVTAAGALMDSELTNITAVKALDQGVATTDSPSFVGLTATTADINGGTIDGATIATSDITVGAGKTLDVSAGTLTLANDQISGDKIQGGTIGSTTITTLTGTTANVTNVNATTVDATNVEVTNVKAKDGTASATIANSTGVMTIASSVLTTTDINGGTIDGVTIGGASAGAGTFTSVTGTSLDLNGDADFGGQINLSRGFFTTIARTNDTGTVNIRSGTDGTDGSSLVMYAGSHATTPNLTLLEADTITFRPVDNSPEYLSFIDGTGAVFNETGADLDFRIESDALTHAFFLQGSDGYVGIGTTSPSSTLDVNGTVTATGLDMNGDADLGANITLSRTNGSSIKRATDTDFLSLLSGTTTTLGANIVMYGGSHVSLPNWNIIKGDNIQFQPVDGSPVHLNLIDGTGAIFNDGGADLDFRIESDTNTHAFFLQGSNGYVGIGTTSPSVPLDVNGRIYTSVLVRSTDGGSAASPSFQPGNDADTGMFWGGTNTIGFSTAGEERVRIDSSGLVGIGTSIPASRLEVADTDGASGIEVSAYRNDTVYGNSYVQFNGPRSSNADGEKSNGRGAITLIGNDIDNNSSLWINAQSSGLNPEDYDDADFQSKQAGLNLNSFGEFSFWKSNAQRLLIDTGGRAIIPAGVTLGTEAGVYNAANTLDDYEEGTWTPVPQDSSGNSGTASVASGYYTKVGNLVYLNFFLENVDTTGLTAALDLRITGLPFSSKSIVGEQFFLGTVALRNVAFEGSICSSILDSTDYIKVMESLSGVNRDFTVVSDVTSGTADIYGTIVYMV